MSSSDSDFSVDWLASDEDDYDETRSPDPEQQLPSSSSGCCCCCSAAEDAVQPLQGFTSVCSQLPVEATRRPDRKRKHGEDSDAGSDTESELFFHKFLFPAAGLSSFQESVAMDRIQRIMGVLQNPDMGGRFLGIVLKIEEMLHSWFPQIKPNQTDDGSAAKKLKRHGGASPPPSDLHSASNSSTNLKWLHTSPICSLKTPEAPPVRPAASRVEPTQDDAISSSTDWTTEPPPPPRRPAAGPRLRRGPPPFKISSPCLERLLQAKESIIAPRTDGDGGVLS
ncbi:uncharacterized protein LOC103374721 [Stegastes partitus]|uniref:Uncharacterized protein LOC103374721 n=1 Tax=Stegastes partitus TaxID=144197 RepID=A0A9Y4NT87_9TELE|nr:PREDICTED: uncharacterized protein LOC103374721 [Stegastes partitus]